MISKYAILFFTIAGLIVLGCNRGKPDTDTHAGETAAEHAAEVSGAAAHGDEHGQAEEGGHAGEFDVGSLVVFPAALQKEFGIRTEQVQSRSIHAVIRALGEIKPAGSREAEVVAPFAGMLLPDPERGVIVRPGERVEKGTHLALLAPTADAEGWMTLLGAYRLAVADYQRARKLLAGGSVTPRRVQEAELVLKQQEARLRGALGGADLADLDTTDLRFHLRAPASGILTDVHLRFGQRVEAGQHLFNIVDPARVWLEAHVTAVESGKLESVKDAYFTLGGSSTIYRTADLNGTLVTVGGLLDPLTRRMPVIIEIDNPGNIFKPGSYAHVSLREQAARESLAIPAAAVLDEDGIPVAMMQVAAEDFRKVVLKTGARDEDYVEVLSGLDGEDRVVVEGAYKVKVAANKPAADAHAGHGH